ncbi:unnamed protein product [Closterium sp. NIES-64]|nr:unnamed protein product [Closterium sp. NIES-64]
MNLSQSGQLSQPGQPSPSTATPATSPPSPSSSELTKKPPPIAAPVSPDSTSSSAPAAPAVPAAPVAVAPREEVWRACLTTSGGLAVAGLLVRQPLNTRVSPPAISPPPISPPPISPPPISPPPISPHPSHPHPSHPHPSHPHPSHPHPSHPHPSHPHPSHPHPSHPHPSHPHPSHPHPSHPHPSHSPPAIPPPAIPPPAIPSLSQSPLPPYPPGGMTLVRPSLTAFKPCHPHLNLTHIHPPSPLSHPIPPLRPFSTSVPFALAAAAIVSAARLALLHLSPAFLAATHASYLTLYTIPPLPFNSSPPSAPIQPPFTPLHPPSPLHPTPVTLSPASIPFALAAAAIVSAARLALLRLSPAFLDATNASNTRALSNLQATDLIWVSLLPGISEVRAAYFKGWLVCTPFHTLLRLSPAFLDATNASNARALSSLNATDLIWVSLLPGISEELLFRGALLPLVGVNAVGVIVSGAVFGLLHVTGDRNLTFSAWASSVERGATSVGCVYGVLAVATGDMASAMLAHSLAPLPPIPPSPPPQGIIRRVCVWRAGSGHGASSVGCAYGVLAGSGIIHPPPPFALLPQGNECGVCVWCAGSGDG